jgi:hypothetical protein
MPYQARQMERACGVAVVLLAMFGGCTKSPPPTRSSDEIFSERMELPALYLTKGGKKISTASGKGPFVDVESGEIAWPALACNRPDCPGRSPVGEPFLFFSPDPAMFVTREGSIGFDIERAKNAPAEAGLCPECLKQRNLANESLDQQQQFRNWVAPYVLPETVERLAQLEAERKRRARRDKHEAITHSP